MPLEKSFFEDELLVEFMYLVFTRMPCGVIDRRRVRSFLSCPLSVKRYYFPLFGDSKNARYHFHIPRTVGSLVK